MSDVHRAIAAPRKLLAPDRAYIEALVVKRPGPRLTDVQVECLHEAMQAHGLVASAGVGTGKGQRLTDRILTPTGWCRVGDLRVGQYVIGSSGKPTQLIGLHKRGVLPTYTVTFNDGSSLVVDGDHLWNVRSVHDVSRGKGWRTIDTRELEKTCVGSGGRRVWRIPLVEPVHFRQGSRLPFDPYLLGVLLGDGSLSHGSVSFCCGDDVTPEEVRKVLPKGVFLTKQTRGRRVPHWALTGEGRGRRNPLLDALRALGLQGTRSHSRFIPSPFLLATPQDRLALLQGLMDTDGEITATSAHFSSASSRLVDDVTFLVESLGGTTKRTLRKEPKYTLHGERRIGKPSHRLTICLPPTVIGARALASRWPARPKYPATRMVVSVTPSDPAEIVCLSVAAADSLYVTERFIVTHNSLVSMLIATVIGSRKPLLLVKKNLVRNLEMEHAKWGSFFNIVPFTVVTYDFLSDPRNTLFLQNLDIDLLVADEAHLLKHAKSARTKRVLAKVVSDLPKVAVLTGTLTTRDCSDYAHLSEAALRESSPIPVFDDTACLAWKRVLGAIPDPEEHDWTYVRPLCQKYGQKTDVEGGRAALLEHLRTTAGFVLTTEASCRSSLVMERIREPELPVKIREVIEATNQGLDPDGEPRSIYETDIIARQLQFGFWYRTTADADADTVDIWRRAAGEWGRALREYLKDGGAPGVDSPALAKQAAREGRLGQFAFQALDAFERVEHTVRWTKETVWLWDDLVAEQIAWLHDQPEPAILWYRHQAIGDQIAKHFPVYARNANPSLIAHKCGMSIPAMHQGHNLQSWCRQRVIQPPAEAGVWQQLLGRTHRLGQTADEVFCDVLTHTSTLRKTLDSALSAAQYVEETTGERQRLKLATWV